MNRAPIYALVFLLLAALVLYILAAVLGLFGAAAVSEYTEGEYIEGGARRGSRDATEGPSDSQVIGVPPWAKVAPEQIAEAKKHGVPVAFENDLGMRFVLIPAGTYKAGPPRVKSITGEGYQHEQRVDKPFYMQITEVTNAQYRRFAPKHVRAERDGYDLDGPSQPVCSVTWSEAVAFAEHAGARLPTEAEWERAARGGLAEKEWPWGDEWNPKLVNFVGDEDGYEQSSPVGSFPPNRYGLYDMTGNVEEWCADRWVPSNYERPNADSVLGDLAGPWPVGGSDMSPEELEAWRRDWKKRDSEEAKLPHRSVRGGSWMVPNVDCARRFGLAGIRLNIGTGFRLVSPLPESIK